MTVTERPKSYELRSVRGPGSEARPRMGFLSPPLFYRGCAGAVGIGFSIRGGTPAAEGVPPSNQKTYVPPEAEQSNPKTHETPNPSHCLEFAALDD
jgi:hypothetical protein